MKFSIITPCYNSERFIEQTLASVAAQRDQGYEVEHIVIDGGSEDGTLAILDRYRDQIQHLVSEPDGGPAEAINKGLSLASGDLLAWLNADDVYHPEALWRVADVMQSNPSAALCFGRCRIVNENGKEIRRGITRFKEAFYPLSSRFMIQCINYVSQPAMWFRRNASEAVGRLNETLVAAWDYEYLLRLWKQGKGVAIGGSPLADFRWHPNSISASRFQEQFAEEYQAAVEDAGRYSPQRWLHAGVRWSIVAAYTCLSSRKRGQHADRD